MRHPQVVLDEVEEFGTALTDQDASPILKLPQELQQREWGLICSTIYFIYAKIILENTAAVFKHVDGILALTLQHYQNCIVQKDNNLKLCYLETLSHLTSVLSQQEIMIQSNLPHKLEIVAFMVDVIRKEPINTLSSPIRQNAMNIITDFRKFKPILENESWAELLRTCLGSVLALPPSDILKRDASSPSQGLAVVCLCQLLDALVQSGYGGINLESQVENITNMLFKLVSLKVLSRDSLSVENHSLAMRGFYNLTKLYNEQVVILLLKTLASKDPARILCALQVFQKVFREVNQTELLKRQVMNSVIVVIQEEFGQASLQLSDSLHSDSCHFDLSEPTKDFLPPRRMEGADKGWNLQVRMALLGFLEILAEYGYLRLPQGNVIISYIIKLSQWDFSLPLPKLVNFVCHPTNFKAFLILSKAATEIAVQSSALGHFPYLSKFHRSPALIISPQTLLTQLVMLDPWLNSHKDNERERAMWITARVLGFTAQMNNFEVEIQFARLGRLVRMLAIRCQDSVDNISFLSSQAVYNLYCILLQQKQMLKKRQGTWEEEDKTVAYSAHVFHNNTYKIAKAFAEYFTQIQVTNLVLTAMESLTDGKVKMSLAAAQLMSAVMKERGRDVIKISEVVDGILERLHMQLEPSTREETLQAMCALAGSNTPAVVPMLLSKSLPWDRTKLALWKAFGAQRETAINILQVLIAILEKKNREETKEMALQPVAAVCALHEMLSGPLCHEAIQELYPRLLLAVLCHLYWVMEQNIPQKLLVYSSEETARRKGKHLDPTSCALEVVRLVLVGAAYEGVAEYARQRHCWDLLSSPKTYYIGMMDLASGIVKKCEPNILQRILNHIKNMLYSPDHRQRLTARTLYVQLLWHRSVAETIGQDCVGNLIHWAKEPSLIMKEIGLRGISNLALHPTHSKDLKSLVPFLRTFLKGELRVTVQAVKGLRNIIYHRPGEDTKLLFCDVSRQLCPLINDERDQVRVSATSALGHMLHRVFQFKPGMMVRKEIYSFLVPLLLSIQDNNVEVVKACRRALTEWTKVIGWSSLTQMFRHTTLSDHIQVLEETCKFLVSSGRLHLVGELLTQSFGFLSSHQVFLRVAALNFIELIIKNIQMCAIHEDDVEEIQTNLECMKNDSQASVRQMASDIMQKLEVSLKPQASRISRLSQMSITFLRASGIKSPKRKKHLFKGLLREEDDGYQKRLWLWCRGVTRPFYTRCRHQVHNAWLVMGTRLQRLQPERRGGQTQHVQKVQFQASHVCPEGTAAPDQP
ncbi:PREDICTED: maestro heat-like repeat-containing protein family member 7 [Dipodomys ordii]|uniref:Maestro heat-like repeat-containing protein family member 7 n=1 Tax=Dipodomys ordii TaxID=10020 RepID=A0A1S3FRS7_DIPOR|nr:PREDICTED: maestro heat-like repeat-containing protein family member 7 [Dipodomys ordii]